MGLLLMEKEVKYVAPEVEILSAQVEKGVYASGNIPGIDNPGGGYPE